jgi:hypothetical protein
VDDDELEELLGMARAEVALHPPDSDDEHEAVEAHVRHYASLPAAAGQGKGTEEEDDEDDMHKLLAAALKTDVKGMASEVDVLLGQAKGLVGKQRGQQEDSDDGGADSMGASDSTAGSGQGQVKGKGQGKGKSDDQDVMKLIGRHLDAGDGDMVGHDDVNAVIEQALAWAKLNSDRDAPHPSP